MTKYFILGFLLLLTACQPKIYDGGPKSGLILDIFVDGQKVNDKLLVVDENTELDLAFELSYFTDNLEDVRFWLSEVSPEIQILSVDQEWTGTLGKTPIKKTMRFRVPVGNHMVIASLSKGFDEKSRIAQSTGIQLSTEKPDDARNCDRGNEIFICDWYDFERVYTEENGRLVSRTQ